MSVLSNNTTKEGDIRWHSTTQKKSNKDDAKENSFNVITVPCHVSSKFGWQRKVLNAYQI